jgi:MFS family permease
LTFSAVASARPARKRRLPLIALFTANAVSMTGNVLAVVAIPWFVLQTTGSAAQTGITGFFTVLPIVVATFLGGNLIDRLGYRRASILADLVSGTAIALIPLLHITTGIAFWQLLALVFVGNLFDAPGTTAREALIPDLAELAGMRLERATAALQAVERGSRMVGAPLAGVLIALFDPTVVLWIDAGTFLFSALLVTAAVPIVKAAAEADTSKGYLSGLFDGLRFIWNDRLLLAIVGTVMITNLIESPEYAVVLPVYVKEHFGSAVDLGLMLGLAGAGSLVGAIIFGAIGHRLPRRTTFTVMFVALSLRFWALAAFPTLAAVLVVMTLTGLASGPLNPIISTVAYERIPSNMRGRVLGSITAVAYLAMPVGMLLSGYVIELVNVQWLLIALGVCYLATTLTLAINPAIREMDLPSPALSLPISRTAGEWPDSP